MATFDEIVTMLGLFEEAEPEDYTEPDIEGSEEYDFTNQWDRVHKPGDRFHVTPVKNLTGIAKKGLQPNADGQFGFNFGTELARDNSRDRVFYTARLADTSDWHRLIGRNFADSGKENRNPVRATLRAKDPDPGQFHVDDLGNNSEQYSEEPMPTDKLDVWHAKTGWTPLAAHSPERWAKVRPGHLRLDAKPKGQMQLFPKELYNEAVMNIVDALLSETTFLQSYKEGDLSKGDIHAMSAMRKEASAKFGQKIPVLSTNEGLGFGSENTGSRAYTTHEIARRNDPNSNWDMTDALHASFDQSSTEHLHHKLAKTTPHVLINVDGVPYGGEKASDKTVDVLGHELGHVIDPVQNDTGHAKSDRKGRDLFMMASSANRVTPERQKTIKSEGRAWRVGRELQASAGALDPDAWKQVAKSSLRSYTRWHTD